MTNWINNPHFGGDKQKLPAAIMVKRTVEAAKSLGFQPLTYDLSKLDAPSDPGSNSDSDSGLVKSSLFFESCFSVLKPGDTLVVQLTGGFSVQSPELSMLFLSELKHREIRLICLAPILAADFDLSDSRCQSFGREVLSYFSVLVTASSELRRFVKAEELGLPVVKLDFLDFLSSNVVSAPREVRNVLSLVNDAELLDLTEEPEILEFSDIERREFVGIGRGFGWIGASDPSRPDLDLLHLSFYLAAGQVILVSEKSKLASLIEEEGFGRVIKDKESFDAAFQMTEMVYQSCLQRVFAYRASLTDGFSTKYALFEALQHVNLNMPGTSSMSEEEAWAADFTNWLTSRVFLPCKVSGYEKIGMWRFGADGSVSSPGDFTRKNWRLRHRRLEVFDGRKTLVCYFWIPSKIQAQDALQGFSASDSADELFLIPSGIDEVESARRTADADPGDLTSFMEVGSGDYERLKTLAAHDKLIDGYFYRQYFVFPSEQLVFDLPRDYGIYYRLEFPLNEEVSLSKKLLVCLSVPENMAAVNAQERFTSDYRTQSMSGLIARDTFILCPILPPVWDEEDESQVAALQHLITKLAKEHEIPRENILFYGYGASGAAALRHALYGNHSVIAFAPELTRKQLLAGKMDDRFSFDHFPWIRQDKLKDLLEKTSLPASEIQLIVPSGSEDVELDSAACQIREIDFDAETLLQGENLSALELTLLNDWLYKRDIAELEGEGDND